MMAGVGYGESYAKRAVVEDMLVDSLSVFHLQFLHLTEVVFQSSKCCAVLESMHLKIFDV
jgi:hypothetical protein